MLWDNLSYKEGFALKNYLQVILEQNFDEQSCMRYLMHCATFTGCPRKKGIKKMTGLLKFKLVISRYF